MDYYENGAYFMLLKRRLNIEHLIGNQWEVNTDRIIEIVNNINEYQKFRIDSYFSKTRWRNICGNIVSVLYVWKGNTYVGTRKSKKIEKSFQLFYVELVSLTESIINDQFLHYFIIMHLM